jgi:hypothetical protein
MTTDWDASDLPRRIVALLEEPRTLAEIAERLEVTDARVLWYLGKLRDASRVVEDTGLWRRTAAGAELAESPAPNADARTELPGASAQDYVQAYADTAAGMFGSVRPGHGRARRAGAG